MIFCVFFSIVYLSQAKKMEKQNMVNRNCIDAPYHRCPATARVLETVMSLPLSWSSSFAFPSFSFFFPPRPAGSIKKYPSQNPRQLLGLHLCQKLHSTSLSTPEKIGGKLDFIAGPFFSCYNR